MTTPYPYAPYFNPGNNTFTKTVYFSPGSGNIAFVIQSGALVTATGITVTGGTFASPVFSGSITGTYTLAGTPTITAPTINGGTISGATFINSIASGASKVTSAQVDVTSSTTLVSSGMSVAVVAAGVYQVEAHLTVTAGASGGIKVALVGTSSMTATSASYTAWNYNGTTLNAVSTTTTFGNAVGGATAVSTNIILKGVVVVNAAGNIDLQFTQNASNGTATSVLVNSLLRLTRVS